METQTTFPTRRLVQPFVRIADKNPTTWSYTSVVHIRDNEIMQGASLSFTGDKKEQVLGAILESVVFSHPSLETLNGNMLMIRNAILGTRTTYDMAHNRTHIALVRNELDCFSGKDFTVTIHIKQLPEKELKEMFSAKTNADLFDAPELFVATLRRACTGNLAHALQYNSHITPISKYQITIPFQTMDDIKEFEIDMKDYVPQSNLGSAQILQMWFMYDVQNIRTTSSMFDTLTLVHDGEIVHQYSSPVQLQVLDKLWWDLFASNPSARSVQEKYLTMTTYNTPDFAKCKLRFNIHKQFFVDYTNWINEDKNKLVEIKDAVILVQFGFLYAK